MFTPTAFEILLFEARSVLWPAQRVLGSELKFQWKKKKKKNHLAFTGFAWKVVALQV